MPAQSTPEMLARLEELSADVLRELQPAVEGGAASNPALERIVLQGLQESSAAVDRLHELLDSGRDRSEAVEALAGALGQAEQKLRFFHSCTMRRSAYVPPVRDEASSVASRAEALADEAGPSGRLDVLVEAYKALERFEAQVLSFRGQDRSNSGPEPRVLDLPRARVVAARRKLGAAIRQLDQDDDDAQEAS